MPPTAISPVVGVSNPDIALKIVVLPAPLGPMRPTMVFGSIVKKTSSSAVSPPNFTVKFEIEMLATSDIAIPPNLFDIFSRHALNRF